MNINSLRSAKTTEDENQQLVSRMRSMGMELLHANYEKVQAELQLEEQQGK